MGLGPSHLYHEIGSTLQVVKQMKIIDDKDDGMAMIKCFDFKRFRENGMPIFYCAGCKFLWLAHWSKGGEDRSENRADASVGQVTGR